MDYTKLIISSTDSLLFALKKMDAQKTKLLIVADNDSFISLISIGDIQRSILNEVSLDTAVKKVVRKDIKVAFEWERMEDIKARMLERGNTFMPVITKDNRIIKVIFWDELFLEPQKINTIEHKLPVVIMAGGKGSRLKPITNVLPKPLIPINKKTIIEEIMDRFTLVGCSDFFISVNYKAEMIQHYFNELSNPTYQIEYFKEDKPLGTAGSLFLLKGKINSTFFVSNCDIIIDQDLSELYNFHKESGNELTVVSALKHYPIPYGTIETTHNGQLKSLKEKPELLFQINSGMYILEPHLLDEIPENTFFHITELIENLNNANRKVGVYPVSEGSWQDIGEWDEYLKQINYSHE